MLMNREQIKEVLPHREPFLLVDEVEEMEVGKSIVAKKYVTEDEYYFQGHFPGRPIMPGVLIVESLAQAKAMHDDLEAVYNPRVDFEGVYRTADQIAGTLLARL